MTVVDKNRQRYLEEEILTFANELNNKDIYIKDLQDTIAEFQDFLNKNPDVKELHKLKCQLIQSHHRIKQLESTNFGFNKKRVIQLEKTLTNLENYVNYYNIDGLKQKLKYNQDLITDLNKKLKNCQDVNFKNNGRIEELENDIEFLEKAFNDKNNDFEEIERLLEDKEKEIKDKNKKIQDLKEAFCESFDYNSDSENVEQVIKLLEKITFVNSGKCSNCQFLTSKLRKSEKKLERLTQEVFSRLSDINHTERDVLETVLSQIDIHLAILEISGLKSQSHIKQFKRLQAEKKKLQEKLSIQDNSRNEFPEEEINSKENEAFRDFDCDDEDAFRETENSFDQNNCISSENEIISMTNLSVSTATDSHDSQESR